MPTPLPQLPGVSVDPGWHFGIVVEAGWGDIDKLGHVNNASYWRWCDDVRVQYAMEMGLEEPSPQTLAVVVVAASA